MQATEQPSLSCIGILAHPKRAATFPIAERVESSLKARGIHTWLYKQWDEDELSAEDLADAQMVIAIGGDGTMFRAARACAPHHIPVLGINMGRLGFVTEIPQPEDWDTALDRVLKGDYWIEERMMITAAVYTPEGVRVESDAVNDVVISGDGPGRMVQLDAYIDRHWTTTYNTDALIVATPTGSTAYALAVGGPILPPDLKNILIVPTAPHLSMDRAIVLSEGSTVSVKAAEENRNGILLTVDGIQLGTIKMDEVVHISACGNTSRFVRLRSRTYFYRSLLDRLEPRISLHSKRDLRLNGPGE
ncbi:MAG: NAD(+)/NADH kinase [Anaerolineaceae bacterium]|nr:NAD(+)/NADH kinase [Anaerolineaceae bacterium]